MGANAARDFAENVKMKTLRLEVALEWHLRCNHFPPIPYSMVAPCKRAIAKANLGLWNSKILLPPGISYKGKRLAPVWAIIEEHHLSDFLDQNEDENEYYEEEEG